MAGAISVQLEIGTGEIRDAISSLIADEGEFVLQDESIGGIADVVMLELDTTNPSRTFGRIQTLQDMDVPVEVFLTAATPDPELLIQCLRSGVREFFKQPLDHGEVQAAFAQVRHRLAVSASGQPRRRARIITVIGGKAGVGATTVAVNLADCIQQIHSEKAIALVDLNLRGGDIPALLDVNPPRGLQDIDADLQRLDETFLTSMMSRHETGLYLLPLGDVDLLGGYITSDCVENTFALLRVMFDYIVVDCGHVVDVATQAALESAGSRIVVTAVTIPAVRRTKRLLEQLRSMDGSDDPRELKLIVNCYSFADDTILADAEHVLGQKPACLLPLDHETACAALNEGSPIARMSPRKELSKRYMQLAQEVSHAPAEEKSSSVFGGVLKSIGSRWSKTVPAT